MYYLAFMKWPTFNLDSILRMKLIWNTHVGNWKDKKYWSVWPCIYGIDKGSLLRFMEKKQTREDIIEIEKRKWLEFSEITNWYEFKYERREEVISYLKSRPFNNSMWKDIGESWKIKIEDKRMIIKSD